MFFQEIEREVIKQDYRRKLKQWQAEAESLVRENKDASQSEEESCDIFETTKRDNILASSKRTVMRPKRKRKKRKDSSSPSMFSQDDSEDGGCIPEDVTNQDGGFLAEDSSNELTQDQNSTNKTVEQTTPSVTQSSLPASGRAMWKVCGHCSACQRKDDCGECNSCKDKVKNGGSGRLKQKCRFRTCKDKTRLSSQSQSQTQSQSKSRLYVRKKKTNGHVEPRDSTQEFGDTVEVELSVEACDLGFAKTKNRNYFPAWKVSQKKDRIKVVFFTTGETAYVPFSSWMNFSVSVENKLVADTRANAGSFSQALAELKQLQARLERDGDLGELQPVSLPLRGSQIPAHLAGQPRKLGKLRNSLIEPDEQYNAKVFKEKIVVLEDGKFECRLCPGKKLRPGLMKASRHARMCGARPKLKQVRTKVAKHWCSEASCGAKFTSVKVLQEHYRSEHKGSFQLHRCWKCKTKFSSYRSLKRHMKEKHSGKNTQFKCAICCYSSNRKNNFEAHMRARHSTKEVINEEPDELTSNEADPEFLENDLARGIRKAIEIELRIGGTSDIEQFKLRRLRQQLEIARQMDIRVLQNNLLRANKCKGSIGNFIWLSRSIFMEI